ADALQVQDNFDDVLADIVDRRELVPNTFDLNARDRNALEGAQQNSAQRVSERGAIARLKRLNLVTAVIESGLFCVDSELRFLEQARSPPCLLSYAPEITGCS